MGRNEFLKQRDKRDKEMLAIGISMGMQIVSDFYTISLHDPDVMNKDTLGRGRIDKVTKNNIDLDDYFNPAFSNDVEAERYQEEMDRKLREVYGDDLVPFKERYPYLKQFSYDKPKKGWI